MLLRSREMGGCLRRVGWVGFAVHPAAPYQMQRFGACSSYSLHRFTHQAAHRCCRFRRHKLHRPGDQSTNCNRLQPTATNRNQLQPTDHPTLQMSADDPRFSSRLADLSHELEHHVKEVYLSSGNWT
jgi:hypothetical protein